MHLERPLKKEILRFSQKLYQKGYVANHDGNISVKTPRGIWATPTAQSKGDLTHEDMLVCVNSEGKQIAGKQKVFSEINLHLIAYTLRPDIQAVVHAHPPKATAFASCGQSLHPPFIAEAIVTLGDQIPLVPFMLPGCPDTQKTLSNFLPYADVLLLQNHGVLAVGASLEQAYYRLELVEHLADIEWHAKALGQVKPLPDKTVQKLLKKRQEIGLGRPHKDSSIVTHTPNDVEKSLNQIVEEEVRRLLR